MSFKSSIGPSHPISEIATSHVCRLKKTRNEGDQKYCVAYKHSSKKVKGALAL